MEALQLALDRKGGSENLEYWHFNYNVDNKKEPLWHALAQYETDFIQEKKEKFRRTNNKKDRFIEFSNQIMVDLNDDKIYFKYDEKKDANKLRYM